MREDWIEVELGEVCFTTSGGTPSRRNAAFYQGSIPWVKSGELDKGIIYDTEEHISEEAVKKSSAKIFPEGTLLIALYGATIGKLAFLGVAASTNQAICGIYKSDAFESKYLFNFLLNRKQKLISQGTGGAQPNISQTILKKLEIPLAPLPIQRAIVSKIEALFSDLDNGIANFKKAQEQLKIYRQAVLKKAFQGGLSNILRTDELPLGWIEGELGNIISISSGKGLTKENREDDGVYFVYGGNGITGKHSEFLYENEKLIIGRVGVHCGNVHITKPKSWITDNAFVVSFDEDVFDLHFLHYFLTNLNLNKYASSTAQPVISQGKIYPIEISYPNTKEEQNQIVQEIESRLSVCDKMEQSINESIEKAEALRQSILKKAFEGKLLSQAEIEQCKQAADYEPASELLKKIQAEKLAKEQEKKKKPTDKKKSKK
jgi:type I restriction enzyme S subunit